MTSIAFILGVLPLALATGAGAGARNSVGTTVAGGMLASTFLSVIFIPGAVRGDPHPRAGQGAPDGRRRGRVAAAKERPMCDRLLPR